jgi:hypothetical protein
MKLPQGDYEQLVRFYLEQQGIVAEQQQYSPIRRARGHG